MQTSQNFACFFEALKLVQRGEKMNSNEKKLEKVLKEKQLQVQAKNQNWGLKREMVLEREPGSMNDPRIMLRMNTKPV